MRTRATLRRQPLASANSRASAASLATLHQTLPLPIVARAGSNSANIPPGITSCLARARAMALSQKVDGEGVVALIGGEPGQAALIQPPARCPP